MKKENLYQIIYFGKPLKWDFGKKKKVPGLLSSLWELQTFPAEHQATAHSPPWEHHWSTVEWEELHCIAEIVFYTIIIKYFLSSSYRDPLVPDHLINGESFFRISLQTSLDQLLGVVTHIGPLRVGELILTRSYPPLHARGDGETMVGVEWRKPAQQDIHDHPQRPNITGLVVLLRTQNLRG